MDALNGQPANPSPLEDLSPEEQRALLVVQLLQKKDQKPKLAPLSFSQERLWFFEQLAPGTMAYIAWAIHMSGQLNVAVLERCLNEVVRRHETLRTTFVTEDGQPQQVIASPNPSPLSLIDLSHLTVEAREAETQQLAEMRVHRHFDLTNGPLFEATLLRQGSQEHILLLTIHHIISDGWSLGVLIRELATLYRAFSMGLASPLTDLPIQYADFARWQRHRLQGELLETQLAYWKKQLGNASFLELPTDQPLSPGQGFNGAYQPLTLSRPLSQAIKALSKREGVTLFMTMLAGFNVLLSRYSGQEDISVGTLIANRTLEESEKLIGLLTNVLVLRTDLGGNPTFYELLGRMREVALDAYAHQEIPFERILEELRPRRDKGQMPLFRAMLVLQNAPVPAIKLPGLTIQLQRIKGDIHIGADLALFLWETDEGIAGFADYNANLFEAVTIQRMVDHWRNLLSAAVETPDKRIVELPMSTPDEQHHFLFELNQTWMRFPTGATIQELFVAQVERSPDAIAVSFAGKELTYAELNARANQLAHYLRRCGVEPDILVGVAMDRSLDMIVALLGILKAGGGYLPLDPGYPTERLLFMMEDAQIKILLTQEHLAASLSACDAQIVVVDGVGQAAVVQESVRDPENITLPEHLAYVIYTSGSTGSPKGVMISQRALVQYSVAAIDHFAITPKDRILQFASISFDAAAEEIYPGLLGGACVVLRTDEMLDSVEGFLRACAAEGITLLDLPTAYWHTIVTETEISHVEWPQTLRLMILGGERVLPERLQAWQVRAPAVHLVNTYGPTETTIVATMCSLNGGDAPESATRAPIGKPVANRQVYVLGPRLEPAPVGVPGELYIGGEGLARGYLRQPELTAQAFIPDPFSGVEGARLYKTGDRVRYLSDGNVEYLGRVDDQVKIRGFRVELGEIETVLRQYPKVQEAVVLAREDIPGEKQLVAYLVPRNEQALAAGDIREFLKENLPDYMIPSIFVILEALPLTSSGKVNRRALPEPDGARLGGTEEFVAPESTIEKKLAEIWGEVLRVDRISIYDNFFDLGGHSLRTTQVIYRINKAFRMNMPVRRLFEEPTIAGMALAIEEALIEELEKE